ncbi:MAG: hypothetical protein DMG75_08770 [Acidobacteria bacterium]|nr:MAG: hypothetical protein DMG75_08770 [Acidobacteriota bacterium]
MQAMFAGTAWQDGPAKAVGNVGDLGQRIARIAARFLEVARKLRSQMAGQPPGKGTGQRDRGAFGSNILLPIVVDSERCDRACGESETSSFKKPVLPSNCEG